MFFLVSVIAVHSIKKWCISSIKFILHKSHMMCPSVCRLSQFSFNVPVLALNSVTLDAVLSYNSVVGKRARLGNFERAGSGFNPHCGQRVKSEKSE